MYVTDHASARIAERVGGRMALDIVGSLEREPGEPGKVAYIVASLPLAEKAPEPAFRWWERSVGNVLVAIAVDGSVETVFFRRSSQDMSPEFFGVGRVADIRGKVPATAHVWGAS